MIDYRPPADKVRESRLRRWAARLDHRLLRSRAKKLHSNNRGLYQLVNYHNTVVEGPSFEAGLITSRPRCSASKHARRESAPDER